MISLKKLKSLCNVARYGIDNGEIPDTTWRKYKKKCEIRPYATFINEQQAICLLAVCWHKKKYPNANVNVDGVKEYLADHPQHREELKTFLYAKQMRKHKLLNTIIEENTGIKISEKTLYRWASKETYLEYKRDKVYTDFEIQTWCDYTKKLKVA